MDFYNLKHNITITVLVNFHEVDCRLHGAYMEGSQHGSAL